MFAFQTTEALCIGEKMKDFLGRFCPDDTGKSFSPIEAYQLVHSDNLETFVETLRTNSMISKVSALYDNKDYQMVQVNNRSLFWYYECLKASCNCISGR